MAKMCRRRHPFCAQNSVAALAATHHGNIPHIAGDERHASAARIGASVSTARSTAAGRYFLEARATSPRSLSAPFARTFMRTRMSGARIGFF